MARIRARLGLVDHLRGQAEIPTPNWLVISTSKPDDNGNYEPGDIVGSTKPGQVGFVDRFENVLKLDREITFNLENGAWDRSFLLLLDSGRRLIAAGAIFVAGAKPLQTEAVCGRDEVELVWPIS